MNEVIIIYLLFIKGEDNKKQEKTTGCIVLDRLGGGSVGGKLVNTIRLGPMYSYLPTLYVSCPYLCYLIV